MNRSWGGIYFGVILLLLGIGFLAQNFDLIQVGDFLGTWWPTYIFVAMGVMMMLSSKSRGGLFFGGFIVALGVAFQLDQLEVISGSAAGLIWPLVIIFFGASILFRALFPSRNFTSGMSSGNDAIFGENNKDFSDKDFDGIDMSTVFGSSRLDLRTARLTKDKTVIATSTVFGETTILLPKNVKISKRMDVILADIEDHTNNDSDASKTVELTGSIILGELKLEN